MIEEVISNHYSITETFNKFFANIVLNLEIIPSENFEAANKYETKNPVQNAINK